MKTENKAKSLPEDFLNGDGRSRNASECASNYLNFILSRRVWDESPNRYRLNGNRDWYWNTYLKSDHWRGVRSTALTLSDHKCTVCGISEEEISLDVHHISYDRLGFENDEDVEVVCRTCHDKRHSRSGDAQPGRGDERL